ncbi:acyltransferase [Pseudomonas aeruginosa]|uniref:acyltransferase family protein n=1 Tax=Pseudomonas aeruginosa TaxID=287 RepID=UPI000E32411F|nr:acyltransferase family protein [Pseudomonas aeruginosa]NPZ46856.1 acyltransferase [Pseudomonas aeruginosa]
MSPTSALPALACLAVALATCEFIRRLGSARLPASRFVTIDGLRGYLAFFVFLHHSSIWYYYLKDGLWQLPPSRLYAHFGQTSVALFFMVTGFSLREAPSALLGKMLDWLLFSIPSKPDMNGFIGTFRIVAGVTWTLPYEWLFYFCLPFLGVLLGNRPSPVAMAIMAGMIWLVLKAWQPNWTLAYMFVAGGLSALAVRSTHLQRFAASIPGNLLCLALLLLPGVLFPSAYQETAILILGLAFLLIAAGSSLFGLLTQALSRFLGEMTYSMYLLHGCILFISFELLIGRDNAKAFSALEHWLVIGAITPLVVLASYLSFRFIESPAMQRSRQLSALLGKPMLALKRLGRHPTAG